MLKKELETLEKNRETLRRDHPAGGVVVIKGSEILGVWNDRGDALQEGLKKFGNVEFLVRQIDRDDITPVNFSKNVNFLNHDIPSKCK